LNENTAIEHYKIRFTLGRNEETWRLRDVHGENPLSA